MPLFKPTSTLLLLLLLIHSLSLAADVAADSDPDDLDGLEELLAIDEAEEAGTLTDQESKPSDSHSDILKKAQRVVLELTNENAHKVINQNEMVLVLGYAPWCARSAELMPRFAEAAVALKEMGSRILVAKVDAERYGKAAGRLGIKGFPTILLFVNGTALSYTGGFTGEEIVIWARKKTGDPIIRLSSVAAAEEFSQQFQIYAIGFFEKYEGLEYEEFVKAAISNNEIQFAETNDLSIANILYPNIGAANSFLGLVKSEPERFENFEDSFEEKKILEFIEYNKFPLVTSLTELNSARVYSSPMKTQVIIFAEANDFKPLHSIVQNVALKYKTKIMFVYVDSAEDNLAKPFLTLFGLDGEVTTVTAFDNEVGSKYLLESDLTQIKLDEFCSGLLQGALTPYFKSEPIPNAGGLIEKVVGKTFDSSVLNNDNDIFLEVYAPWCMDCEATSKQVEKLAKHFESNRNLKFARIDASVNEHPKLQVQNFPTLFFYPAGDKSNPIKLSHKSNLKQLAASIKELVQVEDGRVVSSKDQNKDEL